MLLAGTIINWTDLFKFYKQNFNTDLESKLAKRNLSINDFESILLIFGGKEHFDINNPILAFLHFSVIVPYDPIRYNKLVFEKNLRGYIFDSNQYIIIEANLMDWSAMFLRYCNSSANYHLREFFCNCFDEINNATNKIYEKLFKILYLKDDTFQVNL